MDSPLRIDLGRGVAVIGAGLAGCLLAIYLKQRGYDVHLYESRWDMRKDIGLAGRSINLILTSRGLSALQSVGLVDEIMKITVRVFSRALHSQTGAIASQRYGPDDSYCNYSISRAQLNVALLNAAEARGVHLYFDYPLDHLDITNRRFFSYTRTAGHPAQRCITAAHIFACDGGGSRARQAIKGFAGHAAVDEGIPLGCGYKELLLPAKISARGEEYAMDPKALHIWPRGSHFMMGLPNLDGSSFTMTLYLPSSGPISFESIKTREQISDYFQKFYPDAVSLIPDVVDQFQNNPTGFLGTVKTLPWCVDDKLVIVGDAAHAIVPFFGQGCNSAFEGVQLLDRCMQKYGVGNVAAAFSEFEKTHKPNTDAIAAMAVDNYYEMMDKVGDPKFLLEKAVEIIVAQKFPIYCSRYAMVTHSLVPYRLCLETGVVQQTILAKLCDGISSPEQADMKLAAQLIDVHLRPFLATNGISEASYNVDAAIVRGGAKSKL